jgi:hypothetical protein
VNYGLATRSSREEVGMAPNTWSLSKEDAHYRPAPKPAVSCGECKWMFPRLAMGSCKYVRGVVKSSDTCDEFESRHPAKG